VSRALIAGGPGFIGSQLSEALLDRGWAVDVVDDLSTGSIEDISHLKGHSHFAYTLDSVRSSSWS
jgi:UDP-glucose 4-epimerase